MWNSNDARADVSGWTFQMSSISAIMYPLHESTRVTNWWIFSSSGGGAARHQRPPGSAAAPPRRPLVNLGAGDGLHWRRGRTMMAYADPPAIALVLPDRLART